MEGDLRANHRSGEERTAGFRLGIYVFKDAEIVDFAAPYGVFSVARRYDPELDTFLIADAMRPVQTQAGFTVLPNFSFSDAPAMDAFLIPGGFGTRQERNGGRHNLWDGDGFLLAQAGGLRRRVHRRSRAHDGIQGGLRSLPQRR